MIVATARKHGVNVDDMLHAYRNPIRVFDLDDLVNVDRHRRGRAPARDRRGWADGVEFIVHAMPARQRFLR